MLWELASGMLHMSTETTQSGLVTLEIWQLVGPFLTLQWELVRDYWMTLHIPKPYNVYYQWRSDPALGTTALTNTHTLTPTHLQPHTHTHTTTHSHLHTHNHTLTTTHSHLHTHNHLHTHTYTLTIGTLLIVITLRCDNCWNKSNMACLYKAL